MSQQEVTRKQLNTTRTVINSDQEFIIVKRFNEMLDIVTPFIKINEQNKYSSNFKISLNQLHRIQTLYEMIISGLAKYSVFGNIISFDCCQELPLDMFGEATRGYIHYTAISHKNEENNQPEIIVEPQLVFESFETDPISIHYEQKIKFKAEQLKAFQTILKHGFILSTVGQEICKLFMTIWNPKDLLVGECTKYEVNNLIQYILPLWSIFEVNISKSVSIKLRPEFLPDQLKTYDQPIMLNAEYNLQNTNTIKIKQIGIYVKVD